MADSFKKILQSGLFKFLVGEEETPYTVHAASIANQSRAFDKMINGNFKGRLSKTETIKDVDEDTFSRFCEFAYKGDYCPPVFEFEEDEVIETGSDVHANGDNSSDGMDRAPPGVDPPAEEAPAAPPDNWDFGSTEKKSKKKGGGNAYFEEPSRQALFHQKFLEQEYSTTQSIDATIEACKPVRNESDNENYLPVFLGHAKLYVFADKYDVQPLKLLALKKLHQTLVIFTPFAQRVGDIVGLIKFTYENTVERAVSSDENTVDKIVAEELRDLVVGYVVSELERISGEEFDNLIGEGGEFVVDFWHKVKDNMLESWED